MRGRKIHALVETLGLPIRFPWLKRVFAYGGYDAQQTHEAAAANHPLRLEVVRRNPRAVGFEVIKKRWVVERTSSWFERNRRLAKDKRRSPPPPSPSLPWPPSKSAFDALLGNSLFSQAA